MRLPYSMPRPQRDEIRTAVVERVGRAARAPRAGHGEGAGGRDRRVDHGRLHVLRRHARPLARGPAGGLHTARRPSRGHADHRLTRCATSVHSGRRTSRTGSRPPTSTGRCSTRRPSSRTPRRQMPPSRCSSTRPRGPSAPGGVRDAAGGGRHPAVGRGARADGTGHRAICVPPHRVAEQGVELLVAVARGSGRRVGALPAVRRARLARGVTSGCQPARRDVPDGSAADLGPDGRVGSAACAHEHCSSVACGGAS